MDRRYAYLMNQLIDVDGLVFYGRKILLIENEPEAMTEKEIASVLKWICVNLYRVPMLKDPFALGPDIPELLLFMTAVAFPRSYAEHIKWAQN